MHLLLIGLRGSGKTTLGRLLAQRRGLPFLDLDELTPEILGEKTVAAAWRRHGEPAFRVAEAAALRRTLADPQPHVIALGGGTPTAPGAADAIRQAQADGAAFAIYLRADPATLRQRLAGAENSNRPSLTGADPLAEIDRVFTRRDPIYRELANWVIEVGGLTEQEVIELLAQAATNAHELHNRDE